MRSPAFPPRRPSTVLRYIVPAFLIILVFYYLAGPSQSLSPSSRSKPQNYAPPPTKHYDKPSKTPPESGDGPFGQQEPIRHDHSTSISPPSHGATRSTSSAVSKSKPTPGTGLHVAGTHPIDTLISSAESDFSALLAKESQTLEDAAAAYRSRRKRHPPPGFAAWYEFARDHNAVIVEEFWDQIYHDLEPFWALPAGTIRREAWDYEMTINVRSGVASAGSDWFWTQIWLKLIKTIEHLLPDMDLALNAMDEPRLVVPWEQMDKYMTAAAKTRKLADVRGVVTNFQKLPKPGEGSDKSTKPREKNWEDTRPYWKVARRGCSPSSLSRRAEIMTDFNHAPTISSHLAAPHSYRGFVSNFTLSTEFCHQPDLQGLNGIFVEPLTVSATGTLFPMFGGSKLAVNNEILLPAPMYWNEEERFTGGPDHGRPWQEKSSGAMWRGVATGGKNSESNWRAFQRHRFVSMNNATKLAGAQDWSALPRNFELPPNGYGLRAQEAGKLGEWVGNWSNVGFIDLMCSPPTEDGTCNYTGDYFAIMEGMKMSDQFGYKYLPDIDGNSFSGRYLGFLRSTSLPVKATLWHEWHDSRLMAWKHFVPMDSRYGDWFGIMEYFLGYGDEVPAHDEAAERIATAGKEWAEKVLRKEDMQIYVLRLLLEYARVSDERREKMGWVDDLLSSSKKKSGW